MFTRCLVCNTPFDGNEVLEHFPRGTRVAYDPDRGRLWAICSNCRRWTLAPIEERWEALEELEKLTTDRARLLSQTDHIALLRAGPLEIVRVGRANLTEEAWWRYGRELTARRTRYRKISFVGSVAVGAGVIGGWSTGGLGLLGAWLLWEHAPDKVVDAARWLRHGGAAWRGRASCPRCGYVFMSLPFRKRSGLFLHPGMRETDVTVVHPCPRCGGNRDGGLRLEGREGERTLRRVLAYHNFEGASEKRLVSATHLIEEAGSPHRLTRALVRRGRRLGDLEHTGSIALEIAANDAVEQRLLELELAQLEAHWQEEEELAAIVDGELTPLPLLETLRRKAVDRL